MCGQVGIVTRALANFGLAGAGYLSPDSLPRPCLLCRILPPPPMYAPTGRWRLAEIFHSGALLPTPPLSLSLLSLSGDTGATRQPIGAGVPGEVGGWRCWPDYTVAAANPGPLPAAQTRSPRPRPTLPFDLLLRVHSRPLNLDHVVGFFSGSSAASVLYPRRCLAPQASADNPLGATR